MLKSILIKSAGFLLTRLGICSFSRSAMRYIYPGHIRVVNYHDIPPTELNRFKAQVQFLLTKYDVATPEDLEKTIAGEAFSGNPKILFTFDDGFQSHGTYVAEYLQSLGVKGWFFVPSAAPDVDERNQSQWAVDHRILKKHENAELNGRVFATWNTWKRWSDFHVVASHTHSHLRFSDNVTEAEAMSEISSSFELLKYNLGVENLVFCWVGGELTSYARATARAVKNSGVTLAFTTCCAVTTSSTSPLRIERTNLESGYSLDRVNLSTCGILDIKYYTKRRKLDEFFKRENTEVSA